MGQYIKAIAVIEDGLWERVSDAGVKRKRIRVCPACNTTTDTDEDECPFCFGEL